MLPDPGDEPETLCCPACGHCPAYRYGSLWNLESPDTGSGVEGLPLPSGTPHADASQMGYPDDAGEAWRLLRMAEEDSPEERVSGGL